MGAQRGTRDTHACPRGSYGSAVKQAGIAGWPEGFARHRGGESSSQRIFIRLRSQGRPPGGSDLQADEKELARRTVKGEVIPTGEQLVQRLRGAREKVDLRAEANVWPKVLGSENRGTRVLRNKAGARGPMEILQENNDRKCTCHRCKNARFLCQ